MTVIAWDGRTLAADKQSTIQGLGFTVTKIFRVPDGLVGFMGSASHVAALLPWFCGDRDPMAWPQPHAPNESADVLHITAAGIQVYCGTNGPRPEKLEDRFVAMGAGRDYAMAAMFLGHDARRAVEVACALDIHCGKGIDTLTLDN